MHVTSELILKPTRLSRLARIQPLQLLSKGVVGLESIPYAAMGLLSKRRGTTSTEESSSPTISPEKPVKDSGAKSRNARASFVENLVTKPVVRSQSSQSDLRRAGVAADGTPVAYDSTTAANHSRRAGNFSLDEGALALGARSTPNGTASAANRRSTFSRGLGDAPLTAIAASTSSGSNGMPRSLSLTAHQPVGEGSLSLAHLLPSESAKDLRTPRPQSNLLDPLGQSLTEVSMHVTDAAGNRVYAPVFEHSDLGTSSSSSGASSPALGHGSDAFPPPVIQLERVSSDRSQPDVRQESGLSAGDSSQGTSSLQPNSAADLGRTRSASASSGRSWRSASPNRLQAVKRKSSKVNPGITGALALSGMALAAPAPGVHPALPQRQRSVSERQSSVETNATGSSGQPVLISRSSEEHSGYESPTPLSSYSPHDSPVYDNDLAVRAMTSIDAIGEFEEVVNQMGAGYALASSKRNAEFHSVFKHIADDDFLIEGMRMFRIFCRPAEPCLQIMAAPCSVRFWCRAVYTYQNTISALTQTSSDGSRQFVLSSPCR